MPHFYHYYQLRVQSIEIGSRPQFYTLCLSPIRIISLLSDAHRASWILCALLKCGPAPAATVCAALTCLDGWAAKLGVSIKWNDDFVPKGHYDMILPLICRTNHSPHHQRGLIYSAGTPGLSIHLCPCGGQGEEREKGRKRGGGRTIMCQDPGKENETAGVWWLIMLILGSAQVTE